MLVGRGSSTLLPCFFSVLCGWGDGVDFFVEFAAVASVRVGVREFGGLGCFGGVDVAGGVFAGGVLVVMVVMVPPSRLSLRWWSWWAM